MVKTCWKPGQASFMGRLDPDTEKPGYWDGPGENLFNELNAKLTEIWKYYIRPRPLPPRARAVAPWTAGAASNRELDKYINVGPRYVQPGSGKKFMPPSFTDGVPEYATKRRRR